MSAEKIPIQNIYFLLCYAWNHLQEKQFVQVRSEDCHKIWDLMAKVLASSSIQLFKRGLHRNYVLRRELRVRPKGKILVAEDVRSPHLGMIAKHCEFDELDSNILPNQIISSTIRNLLRHEELNGEIRGQLKGAYSNWKDFDKVALNSSMFRRVTIHRNMRHYRFALNICELIYQQSLPNREEGGIHFRDFLRDETCMGLLFEQFVKNFLKQEQQVYRVSAPKVDWDINEDQSTEAGLKLLPSMQTDIVLQNSNEKVIIDCKFYKNAFQHHYDTRKFISDHLYQLFTYIKNQARRPGWESVRGMLLYPTVDYAIDEHITIQGHQIRIAAIDLNQEWSKISQDLLKLVH